MWPIIGIIIVVMVVLISACSVNWVYFDAERRGLDAKWWRRIVLLVPGGVFYYLLTRPKDSRLF